MESFFRINNHICSTVRMKDKRASKILDSLSIELTGKLVSIMSEQLLINVGNSTITRIAHSQQLPLIKQPKVLGVDDWAYRKGITYGTILIDMETSRSIDIYHLGRAKS